MHLLLILFFSFCISPLVAQLPPSSKLGIIAEPQIYPNTPFKILIKHQYIDSIFINIYPMSMPDNNTYSSNSTIDSIPFLENFTYVLNNDNSNYQRTELMIPPLPIGHYSLQISFLNHLKQIQTESVLIFSNPITTLQHATIDSFYIYFLDFKTGKPFSNYHISTYQIKDGTPLVINENYKNNHEWKYNSQLDSKGIFRVSNKDYHIRLKNPNYTPQNHTSEFYYPFRYLNIALHQKKEDKLIKYKQVRKYDVNHSKHKKTINPKTTFFLDKDKYTNKDNKINFKALITTELCKNSYTFHNPRVAEIDEDLYWLDLPYDIDSIYKYDIDVIVSLYNNNTGWQQTKTFPLSLYSLITGSFHLPPVKNGTYTLKITDILFNPTNEFRHQVQGFSLSQKDILHNYKNYGEITFKVVGSNSLEFPSLSYASLSSSYKVVDSINIWLKPQNLSTKNKEDYIVSYLIHKETEFPDRPMFDWDEGHYDSNGNFIPKHLKKELLSYRSTDFVEKDSILISFSSSRHPIANEFTEYYYTITSILLNKELGYSDTFSTELKINESQLSIDVDLPEELFSHLDYQIPIKVHFFDIKTPITSIEIYNVNTPSMPKHTPLWAAPNTFLFSPSKHDSLFPYLPYQNEYEISFCKTGSKLLEHSFNPDIDNYFTLKKGLLPEGDYLFIVQSYDSIQQKTIKSKHYFRIINLAKTHEMNASLPFWAFTDKSTQMIGDSLEFYIASAKKEICTLVRIENNGKIIYSNYIKTQGKTKHKVAIDNTFIGGINYHLDALIDGRWYRKRGFIPIQKVSKKINIKYSKFPKKIKRGKDYTIKFQFLNSENEIVKTNYFYSIKKVTKKTTKEETNIHPFSKESPSLLAFQNDTIPNLVYSYNAYDYTYDTIHWGGEPQTFEPRYNIITNQVPPKVFVPISHPLHKKRPLYSYSSIHKSENIPIYLVSDEQGEILSSSETYQYLDIGASKEQPSGLYEFKIFAISKNIELEYLVDTKYIYLKGRK